MTAKLPIDLLTSFARFGLEQQIALRDPKLTVTFTGFVKDSLATALNNDALLHGHRTQNMFEALIVSLGHYKLLKTEDVGLVHPTGQYIAPDLRVILKDDSQWLIEVKNVFDSDPGRQRFDRMTDSYLDKLTRYSVAVHCQLKLALYWARWGIWTLIDPVELVPTDGRLTIDMFKASRVNELARLGDRAIGTEPPLKLRLIVDTSKPRSIAPNGEVTLTFERGALISGNREITDPIEQNIAWIFMQFGDWICSDPQTVLTGNQVDAIELVWTPRERINEPERFEFIGTLSTMFSRYYASQTLQEGTVIQTEAELIPDWFAPLTAGNYKGQALPLWQFILQPNRDYRAHR